jgi:serine protease inhibitor
MTRASLPSIIHHSGFALALLDVVPAAATANVVASPWSVSSALGLLAQGCDPAARKEVERALVGGSEGSGRSVDDDFVAELAADAATIISERGWSQDSVLTVANTLWVDENRTPIPAFTAALDRWPEAALRFAPIAADPEHARQTINADVAVTTRNLVSQILPDGALAPDDPAVIVNALYLFAPWQAPFVASRTQDAPFHGPGGTRSIPMMRASHHLVYARDRWEYVGLPIDLGFIAEVLVLPAGGDRANDHLDTATLEALRRRASVHQVDLHLPRFQAERAAVLNEPLHELGVRRIFSSKSVDRVVADEPLLIAGVYHAAVLRVDETGIEGAAGTAVVAPTGTWQPPAVEVRVDRPFLFLVTHQRTGAVAFVARVREP